MFRTRGASGSAAKAPAKEIPPATQANFRAARLHAGLVSNIVSQQNANRRQLAFVLYHANMESRDATRGAD